MPGPDVGIAAACPGWLRQIDAQTQASAREVMNWGADPLWKALVPVTASMLHSAAAVAAAKTPVVEDHAEVHREARPAQDRVGAAMLLVGGSRAIRQVRVLGDVICLKEKLSHVEFMIDDGTGLLPCVVWRDDLAQIGADPQGLKLGASLEQVLPSLQLARLLHAGGYLRHWRGKMQLNVKFLAPDLHADGMSLFWLQMIRLHTVVYPSTFGTDKFDTSCKRKRDAVHRSTQGVNEALEGNVDENHIRGASSFLRTSVSDSTNASVGSSVLAGPIRHGQGPSLTGLDHSLLNLLAGPPHDCSGSAGILSTSPSGREFLFADVAADQGILDAARQACLEGAWPSNARSLARDAAAATASPASASNQSSELPTGSYHLRAAIAQSVLRLSQKGWLVLVDQSRDAYVYVGTARELSVPLVVMLRQLSEDVGDAHVEMSLDDVFDEAARHSWMRHVIAAPEGAKSIQAALEYLEAESLISCPSPRVFTVVPSP